MEDKDLTYSERETYSILRNRSNGMPANSSAYHLTNLQSLRDKGLVYWNEERKRWLTTEQTVIEDENKILAALRNGRVHAVRIKDGVITEIYLHNGTKLTGAMVVSR